MKFTCDDIIRELSLDGDVQHLSGPSVSKWTLASTYTIPPGTQLVRVKCYNVHGVGRFMASFSNGVMTDGSWQCAHDGGTMASPSVLKANGDQVEGISRDASWIWATESGADTVSCELSLNW